MRYKRSTYIAINVNIQNINIFFYLISLLRNKFPFTQKRPRKKSGARCSWKRVKKSKQFVDMFTLLAYWLSPFFLALLPRQIGYMPILSPDFHTHHARWSSNRFSTVSCHCKRKNYLLRVGFIWFVHIYFFRSSSSLREKKYVRN